MAEAAAAQRVPIDYERIERDADQAARGEDGGTMSERKMVYQTAEERRADDDARP